MSDYVLEMLDIVKYFPGAKALDGVDLKIKPGTVHALMGENGAGKSTLMNCLMGIHKMTSGKIIYQGEETVFNNPNEALNAGISMIHQELSPVNERSVMENIWLGREPIRGIAIDHKKMRKDTEDLFEMLKFSISPIIKMKKLSVAQQQMVEIAKAISYNSNIVIMDEPTSALTEGEAEQLFTIIEDLKKNNVAVVYISHKIDEIFKISDEKTIIRDGKFVDNKSADDLNINKLIELMVGRELTEMFPKVDCPIGDTILKVENLASGNKFRDVSFELRRGEILGFAGLIGAGRTEVAETIFGMRKSDCGTIYINGEETKISSPIDAIENKIALLTEDRRESGVVGVLNVADNILLANLRSYGFPLKHKKMESDTEEYIDKLNVKTPSAKFLAQNLSGGNQQKVLVARWLLTVPDILIVDEPTKGIDVGAKAEIHTLITELAAEGKAIIMISSELPEILGLSDRIIVMHEGNLTGVLGREEATQEKIMGYATGKVS